MILVRLRIREGINAYACHARRFKVDKVGLKHAFGRFKSF